MRTQVKNCASGDQVSELRLNGVLVIDKTMTLDYGIAVGYQMNVAMENFPEIIKVFLLNNHSLQKISKK